MYNYKSAKELELSFEEMKIKHQQLNHDLDRELEDFKSFLKLNRHNIL